MRSDEFALQNEKRVLVDVIFRRRLSGQEVSIVTYVALTRRQIGSLELS